MAFNYKAASMAVGLASSILGGMSQRKAIKAQNAAELKQWHLAYKEVRRQLGVSYGRTQTAINEINRDKIRTQMAVRVAGRVTKGTRAVKAAQMGIQGKRASRDIYVPVDREVANAVSDAERNAAIQEQNALNQYNDTAQAAINNLNNNAPLSRAVPSIGGILVGALAETDFSSAFKNNTPTKVDAPSIEGGYGAIIGED